MKRTLLALNIFVTILTCCKKDDEGFNRSSFLIVGDVINCEHLNYSPYLVFSSLVDSLDIDFDYKRIFCFHEIQCI